MTTFDIHVHRVDSLNQRLATANRRLARAAISGRFTATYSDTFTVTSVNEHGIDVTDHFVTVTLNAPAFAYNGWTFVATLNREEAGIVVQCADGQTLDGWERAAESLCEHCNIRRARNRTYVLRNTTSGELKQVGSSCIDLFLGVTVSCLWALNTVSELEDEERDMAGGDVPELPVREALALAMAASGNGRRYVPSRNLDGHTSTVEFVRDLAFSRAPARCAAEWDELRHTARAMADTAVIDEVMASVEDTDPSTDYGMNLRVILAGESVSDRSLGILVSLVTVYSRRVTRQAERAANPAVDGYLADVKTKIAGVAATVTFVKEIDGAYGVTTIIAMRAESGHVLKWFASGRKDVKVGARVVVSGTVKAHGVYEGVCETVVTRAKLV